MTIAEVVRKVLRDEAVLRERLAGAGQRLRSLVTAEAVHAPPMSDGGCAWTGPGLIGVAG